MSRSPTDTRGEARYSSIHSVPRKGSSTTSAPCARSAAIAFRYSTSVSGASGMLEVRHPSPTRPNRLPCSAVSLSAAAYPASGMWPTAA
jgi:hypothetical protein